MIKLLRFTVILTGLTLVSACELLKDVAPTTTLVKKQLILCESGQQTDDFAEFCESDAWLEYMLQVHSLSWQERFERINDLDDKIPSLIKKIMLSQGVETPFQHRLRAQNWLIKLKNLSSTNMQTLLTIVIYENSKQLLEFESGITILSRVNTRQEKTIEEFGLRVQFLELQVAYLETQIIEREQQIKKQRSQVDQLLKIESDLIEQNRKENR